jgi:hypothetical protein
MKRRQRSIPRPIAIAMRRQVRPDRSKTVKLKLIFVCLAIALAQITPSDAQSISPAGHYTYNRRGQLGEMRVQKAGAEWRVFVIAAGAPRGPATAADCGLLAVGAIEGKTFQGEIKYIFDNTDSKAALDYLKGGNSKPNDIDVEAGHKITITFAPQSATLRDDQGDISAAGCTEHHGLFGRFTKRRK